MAQRQTDGNVKQLQTKLIKQIFFSTLITAMMLAYLNIAHAQESDKMLIAMGDIGVIKNDDQVDSKAQVQWDKLSQEQQSVLAPLSKEWDALRPWQRDKMLDIARDYPKMDAKKQDRVKKRLHAWSRMTPYERENARQRYQKFHSLNPEKKAELRKKWEAHQKLSEAEREKRRKDSNDLLYDPSFD